MKLAFFETIDETIALLEDMTPHYTNVCDTLKSFFDGLMVELDQSIIDVRSRVKSPKSLKEKILRNKLYQKHENAQAILDNLQDVIGIMIFCRFVYEEQIILEKLKSFFNREDVDGWYYSPILENMPIYLNLSMPQPQKQKNGFKIYRVDGHYYSYGEKINFELQIKSLVHSFWADIEHEVIYKNNSYMIVDGFMKEMLASIHSNMEAMDHQIALIYNQINTDHSSPKEADKMVDENFSKVILAKAINDIFINKMKENIGFTIDFKKACDILSQYIFVKNEIVYQNLSSQTMLELITRIRYLSDRIINFETPIHFEHEYKPKSRFGEILSEKLLETINVDFEWNIFFKILFEIEPGSNVEDFGRFLYIIKTRYSDADLYEPLFKKYDSSDAYYIKDEIINAVAKGLAADGTISIIYEENFKAICMLILNLTAQIAEKCIDMNAWEDHKTQYIERFESDISEILR